MLDEREIASGLKDWLIGKDKLDLHTSFGGASIAVEEALGGAKGC